MGVKIKIKTCISNNQQQNHQHGSSSKSPNTTVKPKHVSSDGCRTPTTKKYERRLRSTDARSWLGGTRPVGVQQDDDNMQTKRKRLYV